MSWIDSRHRKMSTGLHFQNGRHNTAKIQHCSISKVAFDLFTDIVSAVGLLSTGNRKHIIWFGRLHFIIVWLYHILFILQLLFVSLEDMEYAISHFEDIEPPLEYRLWHVCGNRIATNVLMKQPSYQVSINIKHCT